MDNIVLPQFLDVSISYIGMVVKEKKKEKCSLSECINLLYRYGSVESYVNHTTSYVSISYIGMVEQYFVLLIIITPKDSSCQVALLKICL